MIPTTASRRPTSSASILSALALALALPGSMSVVAEGIPVESWRTREGAEAGLVAQPTLRLDPKAQGRAPRLRIDPSKTFQRLTGLGNSLEHSTCHNLSLLPADRRRAVLESLFDAERGIGMSLARICIGTPDFTASPWYTYDDLPSGETDPEMRRFSIEKDRAYVLPMLKEAQRVNPGLKFFASPWSPPGWMKTSGRIEGGAIDPRHFPAFAEYLARFVEAYRAEGIGIHALTLQNEPEYAPDTYPTCLWTAEQQRDFVRDHLGPKFRARGITTRIWVFDHNFEHPEFPTTILSDPKAAPFVDGTGFHHYVGTPDAMSKLHGLFPQKAIHFTEGSVFGVAGSAQIATYLNNWACSYTAWVTMIDKNRKPNPGPHPCSLTTVVLDPDTRTVSYRPDYHLYGHFMKYLRPGAVRLGVEPEEGVPVHTVFRNVDGSVVLVAANPGDTSRPFTVDWRNASFTTQLEAKTVATFRWKP